MITARAAGLDRAPLLVVAAGGAAVARFLIGGADVAASVPGAVVFSALLLSAAAAGGARFTGIPRRGVALGAGGGVALVALSLVGVPSILLGARVPVTTLAWWMPLVTVVATSEELVFRGVLFEAVRARSGDVVAIALTSLLFAAIHVPLYGSTALPIDLCVGVFLGCLRVAAGSVSAPLIAHVLADVATGLVG